MHIDLNSCFATIEQQANPHLRGKPVVVAAYTTDSGCILAPSVEAKRYGIKTGMRVKDGKLAYPGLIVLSADPNKYRSVHVGLRKILSSYTNDFNSKSIDEFVLNLDGYLHLHKTIWQQSGRAFGSKQGLPLSGVAMESVAREIKERIKKEIGEWLTVSIGIAPNRFLAKTASGLNKPDGLDEIDKRNHIEVYRSLKLTDLCGIKLKNTVRLNSVGVYSVLDFSKAPVWKLKAAFNSINGYYWYLRLRGWEIDDVDFGRRSYGNSYALPKPLVTCKELSPILSKLVEKMGSRLRRDGYRARGVHVSVVYKDHSFWHKGISSSKSLFDSRDIYKKAFRILLNSPYKKPVGQLAVSCYRLEKTFSNQLDLFEDVEKKKGLVEAIDDINERWGDFVITPARMLWAKRDVPDRIAFGATDLATSPQGEPLAREGVKELEEIVVS